MGKVARLNRSETALVVVDMQEGFRPIMTEYPHVARRIATAVRAANELAVPVVITEQYPRGLKRTAPEILEAAGEEATTIEKLCFSACGATEFMSELGRLNARHVLLCGIEAHICMLHTALDLLERDYEVHMLLDCMTSRHPENKHAAVARLTQAGAIPSTLEMALFELLGAAGTPEFKAVQALIK